MEIEQGNEMTTNLMWKIGEVEVFQIIEVEFGETIQEVLTEANPEIENIREMSWLYPHFVDETGRFKALVQSFLIKSGNKNILVDTCYGNDKPRQFALSANLKTDFLEQLCDIGVPETNVHIVACTHLHIDHVGWNTKLVEGAWVPTFPNAEYLFVQQEYDLWTQQPDQAIEDQQAVFDDSIRPIVETGVAELVDVNHKIDRHVSFFPTPGHTPSHVGVLIESQNRRAIISGDFIVHPCQIGRPHWTQPADMLPDQVIGSRQRILDEIADTDTLLIGSHFANPVIGRVVRSRDGFVFKV